MPCLVPYVLQRHPHRGWIELKICWLKQMLCFFALFMWGIILFVFTYGVKELFNANFPAELSCTDTIFLVIHTLNNYTILFLLKHSCQVVNIGLSWVRMGSAKNNSATLCRVGPNYRTQSPMFRAKQRGFSNQFLVGQNLQDFWTSTNYNIQKYTFCDLPPQLKYAFCNLPPQLHMIWSIHSLVQYQFYCACEIFCVLYLAVL